MSTTPTITKRCPDCGSELKIRTNRDANTQFIGCASWPRCLHTEPIPETLKLRLMGAPELPIFDDEPPAPDIKTCRSCGMPIVWGFTAAGRKCPFDVVDGIPTDQSHFVTCAQASQWSKR